MLTTTIDPTLEITLLGDADYVAYQRQVEDTRPEPSASGGAVFGLTPPF